MSAKIRNQARCLEILGREGHEILKKFSNKVQSGDSDNMEAQAARKYWPALFGKSFKRNEEDFFNACVNYGYAIVRGALARAVVSRGLHPSFGLHHANSLNPFNLVDDLFEPFRPYVDLFVATNFKEAREDLDKEIRMALANLLNLDLLIEGESFSVLRASERVASSYVEALKNKDPQKLVCPELKDEQ